MKDVPMTMLAKVIVRSPTGSLTDHECYERTFILSFSILSYLITGYLYLNICLYIWTLLLSYQGHMATAWVVAWHGRHEENTWHDVIVSQPSPHGHHM